MLPVCFGVGCLWVKGCDSVWYCHVLGPKLFYSVFCCKKCHSTSDYSICHLTNRGDLRSQLEFYLDCSQHES